MPILKPGSRRIGTIKTHDRGGAWVGELPGTRAIRKNAFRYVPCLHKQSDPDYVAMVLRCVWLGATGKTLEAFQGFVFRQNPEVEVTDAMADFMRDCTMTGKTFYDYSKDVVREVESVGRTGTLIDWDSPANEDRPYVVRYDTEGNGVVVGRHGDAELHPSRLRRA